MFRLIMSNLYSVQLPQIQKQHHWYEIFTSHPVPLERDEF